MIVFIIAAHIAKAIEMRDDPQPRGQKRKHQAQRFNIEGQFQTRHNRQEGKGFCGCISYIGQNIQHHHESGNRSTQCQPVAQIGAVAQQHIAQNSRAGQQH